MRIRYKFNSYKILYSLVLLFLGYPLSTKAQFVERAFEVGVINYYEDRNLIGGGIAIFDVNNDDKLDIFAVGGTRSSALFINNGVSFDKTIVYLGVEDITFYSYTATGVAAGDINNDGFDDLFICTNEDYPNFIMINNQDNTFDVLPTDESGIIEKARSIGASFGDINKDGYLDIYVANYIKQASAYLDTITGNIVYNHTAYPNFLYLNNGDNTFEEVSEQYGLTKTATTLASTFTDFDNDNDIDIYVVNDFGSYLLPNELHENQFPTESFSDISESSGADIGLFGMGVAIGDYDNDLDLDYYITNIGKNELLRNNGDKTFSKVTNEAMVADSSIEGGLAIGWGTGFMDYDNNGWLDLFISNGFLMVGTAEFANPEINPNAFYKNNQDGSFTNITQEMGLIDSGYCRGAAYGDLDNDGDLDLIFVPVNNSGGNPAGIRSNIEVYYNETNSNNNWVKLKLEGVKSNKNAYGSHVLLYDSDGNIQLREVDGGSSHVSSNSSIVHFGIGTATIDSIEIYWINGGHQVERNLEVNQQHVIPEKIDTLTTSSISHIKTNVKVYPNPTTQNIIIDIPNSFKGRQLNYSLITLNGKLVEMGSMDVFPYTISLEEIGHQALFLNIYDDNILIESSKVILSTSNPLK